MLVDGETTLLYVDRIMLHERTGAIALQSIKDRGVAVRRAESVVSVVDHSVDTTVGRTEVGLVPKSELGIRLSRSLSAEFGIRFFDIDDAGQGISHVIAAEQGIAVPGSVVVCPDSHTGTLGGIGCLGIGIGTSQSEQALATQTLSLKKPKSMALTITGELHSASSAKDVALACLATCGSKGALGSVIEYRGAVVSSMGVEGRMTLCNLSVELGAFSGIIGVDEKTIAYYCDTKEGKARDSVDFRKYLQGLNSGGGADFDQRVTVALGGGLPRISWGILPHQNISIDQPIPAGGQDDQEAMSYMELGGVSRLSSLAIEGAFIGSCTNSRLSDLQVAAEFLVGKKVQAGITAMVVPGSTAIKRQAEALGLDGIFRSAGFEWRESGCSLCFYAGGESFGRGARVVSSTNRNFKNRQGPGVKTHIASPLMVALSAVLGRLPDERDLALLAS